MESDVVQILITMLFLMVAALGAFVLLATFGEGDDE